MYGSFMAKYYNYGTQKYYNLAALQLLAFTHQRYLFLEQRLFYLISNLTHITDIADTKTPFVSDETLANVKLLKPADVY